MALRLDPTAGTPAPNPGVQVDSSVESVAAALQRAAVPSAGAGATVADLPQVYMGDRTYDYLRDVADGEGTGSTLEPGLTDGLLDIDSASGVLYEWYGTDKFDRWGDLLVKHGWVSEEEGRDFDVLNKWWNYAAEKSANFYMAGKRLTPHKIMELLAPNGGEDEDGSGGGGSGQPRTTTHTSVDLTDATSARAIVNDALSAKLGRAANPEEIDSFVTVLNSAERSNPSVTTTHYSGDGTTASSTTSGGLGAAGRSQLAEDEALENPEYGAYQAASTYYNALVSALGGM